MSTINRKVRVYSDLHDPACRWYHCSKPSQPQGCFVKQISTFHSPKSLDLKDDVPEVTSPMKDWGTLLIKDVILSMKLGDYQPLRCCCQARPQYCMLVLVQLLRPARCNKCRIRQDLGPITVREYPAKTSRPCLTFLADETTFALSTSSIPSAIDKSDWSRFPCLF